MSRQLLIVEDHPLVAEATVDLLARFDENMPAIVVANAADAIQKLDDCHTDWFRVFLDLEVPGAYGLSLAGELARRGFAARSCVVSASQNVAYIDEIKVLGFLGFIIKAIPVAQFKAALLSALRGEQTFPENNTERLPSGRLTRRQTQMLDMVRLGHSSKEIAVEVNLSEGTVNNHVYAILQSLGAATRAQAVAIAIELGILDPHSAERRNGDAQGSG